MLKTKVSPQEWLILGFILLAALGLRLGFFVGASMEDDLGFTAYASMLMHGRCLYFNDQALRVMTYAPIALAYKLFGVNVFSTHIYTMCCALVGIITAYFLARIFFGIRAAIGASLFLVFVPLHILYSSRTMPSLPEATWGGLSVWLLCTAEDGRQADRRAISFLRYAGVGALIGVAYLCRETGIVMLAVPLAHLGWEYLRIPSERRDRCSQILAVLGGFSVLFGAESFTSYVEIHDALLRWHVVHAAQANMLGPFPWHFFLDRLLNIYNTEMFSVSVRDGLREILSPQNHYGSSMLGLMGFAILVSVAAYSLRAARGPQKIILFWFLAYFLFLSFSVVSLSPYIPIRKFPRYQLLYLTPASIMVGWFFDILWRKNKRKYIVFPCAAILLASSLYYTRQAYQFARSYYRGAVELRRLISQRVDPDIPLYLDGFQIFLFELWDGYHSVYRYRNSLDFQTNLHPSEGAYVVVSREMNQDVRAAGPNVQSFSAHLPADWINIGELNLGYWEYFQLGEHPALYYIPPLREGGPGQ